MTEPAEYRIAIGGKVGRSFRSYPAAYGHAAELAAKHAIRVDVQKDFGVCGWQTIEWCEGGC
jgi:hypothetical protein